MKGKYYILFAVTILAILFGFALLSGIIHINIKNWGDIAIAIVIVLMILWRLTTRTNW